MMLMTGTGELIGGVGVRGGGRGFVLRGMLVLPRTLGSAASNLYSSDVARRNEAEGIRHE